MQLPSLVYLVFASNGVGNGLYSAVFASAKQKNSTAAMLTPPQI